MIFVNDIIHHTLMKQLLIFSIAAILSHSSKANAQPFDSLSRYNDSNVFYSEGFDLRAEKVAVGILGAMDYYTKQFDFKPEVTILVLSPNDWNKYTSFPVYGMPHYTGTKTLIVAASDNPFWQSFTPDFSQLPGSLANEVKSAYVGTDGTVTMEGFFDLLAIHELGHAFHLQGELNMQRKWMGELFCNLFLHTYVAERIPERLQALTVFPQMVVSGDANQYEFRTLHQFEKDYATIAQKYPKNYGWYQCRLHVSADRIYEDGGKKVIVDLWNMLKSPQEIKDDNEFVRQLNKSVHTSVADVLVKW
jgi:hypothetical protein